MWINMNRCYKITMPFVSLCIVTALTILGLSSCSQSTKDANDMLTTESSESYTDQQTTENNDLVNGDNIVHIEDAGEYPQFMLEGKRILKWEEGRPTEEELDGAVRLCVYDSCTIRNSKGEFLRVNMSAGQIYGDIEIYEANLWSDELYVSSAVNYNGILVDGLYMSLIIMDDDDIVITFDAEVEKFKLEYENSSKKRISYCGTGLREIEITDENAALRGDVVTETDEDQSNLDPFDRMHMRAPGREIIVESYEEK